MYYIFWLCPIPQRAMRPDTPPLVAIGGFAFCLAISGILARLSLRRADRLGRGGWLALVTMIPTLQILAVLALALLWPRRAEAAPEQVGDRAPPYQLARGIFAVNALTAAPVAVLALRKGAYGRGRVRPRRNA